MSTVSLVFRSLKLESDVTFHPGVSTPWSVRNPLMVDVPLRALEVVLAGGPVQTLPLSCTLKAEAAQAFTLECRPLGPGFCRLVGVRVTLEAAPTAQPMLWTVTDVPVASGGLGPAACRANVGL